MTSLLSTLFAPPLHQNTHTHTHTHKRRNLRKLLIPPLSQDREEVTTTCWRQQWHQTSTNGWPGFLAPCLWHKKSVYTVHITPKMHCSTPSSEYNHTTACLFCPPSPPPPHPPPPRPPPPPSQKNTQKQNRRASFLNLPPPRLTKNPHKNICWGSRRPDRRGEGE